MKSHEGLVIARLSEELWNSNLYLINAPLLITGKETDVVLMNLSEKEEIISKGQKIAEGWEFKSSTTEELSQVIFS